MENYLQEKYMTTKYSLLYISVSNRNVLIKMRNSSVLNKVKLLFFAYALL